MSGGSDYDEDVWQDDGWGPEDTDELELGDEDAVQTGEALELEDEALPVDDADIEVVAGEPTDVDQYPHDASFDADFDPDLDTAESDHFGVVAPDDEAGPRPTGRMDDAETEAGGPPSAALPEAKPEGLLARLKTHTPTQVGVAFLVGAVALAVMEFGEDPVAGPAAEAPVQGSFPKLAVDGTEHVSEDDVGKILASAAARRAARNGPPPAAAAPPPAPTGPQPVVPGALYGEDGTVVARVDHGPGVFVGDPDDVARGRAREARRSAQPPPPPPPARRGWYAPGGTLDGVYEQAKGETALSLTPGSLFKAKLVVGVSSLAPNVVVAQVTEDVRQDGRVVLRSGDVLRGRARGERDRLYLTFQGVKVGQRTLRFEGYAVERGMPGLVAQVRASSLEERSQSGAGRGALGAAGNVLGEVVGESLPGRVVRGLAEGALPEAQRDLTPDHSSEILELPAGRVFEVVVTEGQS